jgi:hypothetical protein
MMRPFFVECLHVFVGMGQQIDGWFCGRWALANMAVLYENTCKALQEHLLLRQIMAVFWRRGVSMPLAVASSW